MPEPRVAIAGGGVAAATLACLLRGDGVDVVLLAPGRRTPAAGPGVEALPEATVRLLADAGLAGALADAGAVTVRGFENATGPDVHRLDGWWTHVDRARLAAECVRAARLLGTTVLPADAGGAPVQVPGGLEVRGGGVRLDVTAAVDATGRSARWSRPVLRSGHDSATLYAGPGTATARPGRMTRLPDGWAYRLDHPGATVVGVVGPRSSTLDESTAAELEMDAPERFTRLAVRPASVQWSRVPVRARRLAVGDAALAMSPISGQGLRFAVSSAFAAAHVLRSWLDDGDRPEPDDSEDSASEYYRAFVDGVRLRHLAKIDEHEAEPAGAVPTVVVPDGRLRWTASTKQTGMPVGGRIVAGECCVLPDGGLVRHVGGIDLLTLRTAVGDGRTSEALHARLVADGIEPASARMLVAWAVRSGVLAGPSPQAAAVPALPLHGRRHLPVNGSDHAHTDCS